MVHSRRNWVAPKEKIPHRREDGSLYFTESAGEPPPDGELPMLILYIYPSKVRQVGHTDLATYITSLIKKAEESLPPEGCSEPKELNFLRTMQPDKFARAVQRFDMNQKHVLSFRQIAWWEKREEQGTCLPFSSVPRYIGEAIIGEDGVENDVKRIYEAIHREPYLARRRRLDAPAQGLGAYACPDHPQGDCPASCGHVHDFGVAIRPHCRAITLVWGSKQSPLRHGWNSLAV